MALYLKELALLETTTNTLVKLVNVMEGIEGSAVFGYNTENITIQTGSNRTEQVVTRHTLDIRIKDDADAATQATLTAWANNPELRFKASGYSGDTFLLWDEPVPIVFSRQYDLIGARRLTMTLDAVPGFNGASGLKKLPVYSGQNLLGIYQVLSGSATLLNGFTETDTGTVSVSGSNQTYVQDAGALGQLYSQRLFFPFNTIVTFSLYLVSSTNELPIGFAGYQADGTLILKDFNAGLADVPSSRGFVTSLLSATDYPNLCFIEVGMTQAASDTSVFNTPAIRLGFETAFTN